MHICSSNSRPRPANPYDVEGDHPVTELHLQDSLESLGSLMDSRQASAVPGLPQNASSRAGLGNLKRLGSSRGRLDVKVRTVSRAFRAASSWRRSSVFSFNRGQADCHDAKCRSKWPHVPGPSGCCITGI